MVNHLPEVERPKQQQFHPLDGLAHGKRNTDICRSCAHGLLGDPPVSTSAEVIPSRRISKQIFGGVKRVVILPPDCSREPARGPLTTTTTRTVPPFMREAEFVPPLGKCPLCREAAARRRTERLGRNRALQQTVAGSHVHAAERTVGIAHKMTAAIVKPRLFLRTTLLMCYLFSAVSAQARSVKTAEEPRPIRETTEGVKAESLGNRCRRFTARTLWRHRRLL